MTLLITGGCGFIGINLVRMLVLEQGLRVVNCDKLSYAADPSALADLEGHPGYVFEQVDLAESAALLSIFARYRPQAVLHLAAESHVDRSLVGPDPFIQSNIVGTYQLLEAALAYWKRLPGPEGPPTDPLTPGEPTRAGFRFLHVSTDEVFGALAPGDPAFTEASPYAPRSPYAASKAAADHLVRAWHHSHGLPVLLTNCGNNYGPHQHPEKFIPQTIRACRRGEPIPVYGRGEQIRDWIHVADHCSALLAVLTRGRVGETYAVGARNERRNLDVVRQICACFDARAAPGSPSTTGLIRFVTDRPGHDFRYGIDPQKLESELGWQPTCQFETELERLVGGKG